MPRVVHFELAADNPDRAVKFYASVFGWEIQKWNGPQDYWLIKTGKPDQPGIDGAIMTRAGPQPVVNTIDVPSVDEFVAKITKHGGTVMMPKMAVPGVGWLAYCQDTEGNAFGIIQDDRSAK